MGEAFISRRITNINNINNIAYISPADNLLNSDTLLSDSDFPARMNIGGTALFKVSASTLYNNKSGTGSLYINNVLTKTLTVDTGSTGGSSFESVEFSFSAGDILRIETEDPVGGSTSCSIIGIIQLREPFFNKINV